MTTYRIKPNQESTPDIYKKIEIEEQINKVDLKTPKTIILKIKANKKKITEIRNENITLRQSLVEIKRDLHLEYDIPPE